MRRTNTFAVRPLSESDEHMLRDLLDASAALWNETNYQRLVRYDDEDGFEDDDVWDADTGSLEGRYKSVLGASTAQQVIRTNSEAWRSFFRLKDRFFDAENTAVTTHPEPPGFRGSRDDGRDLMTTIRKDAYTIEWGERSRLEILVGSALKEKYGHTGRLRLGITGDPTWPDFETQGRLVLEYDEVDGTYRAFQPVTVADDSRETPLAAETAALDIGANNLLACTTTTGRQYLYEGSECFERFLEATHRIADLQSNLPEGRYSSRRIRRLYRKRTRRRDHAQAAVCRDLLERLYEEGVGTVYIGGLTGVLETHWSVEVNTKTHNFWSFEKFATRLACTAAEYGIAIEVRSEAWTSQECPDCGSTARTTRHRDTLTCPCGFEGHADLTASKTFLERQTTETVRPMARPVRFKWDDHIWSESPRSHRPNEQRTYPSTIRISRETDGNVASRESA